MSINKLILTLIFCCISLTSFSQQQMFLKRNAATSIPNLDDYPPSALWSLETLLSSWEGNDVVSVRKSGEISTTDFTTDECKNGTLEAHCPSDCFVQDIYDQTGNGKTASQSDTSKQAKIVSGGVLIIENSLPAIDLDGSNDNYAITSTDAPSIFIIAKNDVIVPSVGYIIGATAARGIFWSGESPSVTGIGGFNNPTVLQTTTEDTIQHLASFFSSASPDAIYIDGSVGNTGSIATMNAMTTIGTRGDAPTLRFNGKFQLIVLYSSDQSANRTAIETIINNLYSIY